MVIVSNRTRSEAATRRRFVSEQVLAEVTGRKRRTLQKDRLLGNGPFPFYKVQRQVLYDLDEVVGIIDKSRIAGAGQS